MPRTRARQCHLPTSTSQRRRVCKRPAIESIKRHGGCARKWSIRGLYLIRPTMCVASTTPRVLRWESCKDWSLPRTPTLSPKDSALASHPVGLLGSGDLRLPAANRRFLGSNDVRNYYPLVQRLNGRVA